MRRANDGTGHFDPALLRQEGGELLAQLLRDCSDLEARAVCDGFKDGYRLGAKLTAAVFYGDKTA